MRKKKTSGDDGDTPKFHCWDMPAPADFYHVIFEFRDGQPNFEPIFGATSHEDAMWIALSRRRKKRCKGDPEWIQIHGRCSLSSCPCGGEKAGLRLWFGPMIRRWDAMVEKLRRRQEMQGRKPRRQS